MKSALWVLLLLSLWLTGCRDGKTVALSGTTTAEAATPETVRTVTVEVFEVAAATEGRPQPIPAVISVERTAAVLAKRDGIIIWLGGQEGTHVKQGEVLARLNDDDSGAQLRQTELEIMRLQIEERQYEAMLKVNRSELERQQKLAHDGIVSQSEIERAQYKVEVSQQELDKTKLATRMAQARTEAAKLEVEKTVIRAPLTGIVTQRLAKLSSSVVRNDKLFEIAQLAPLEVRFQLAQTDAWQPRPGALVQLALADDQRVVATARLQRVAPVADVASNARSYFAILLGNTTLIPGTAVSVLRPHINVSSGYWIPRTAFAATEDLQRGTSAVLLVVEDGKCAARTVWLGALASDQVEVRSGLMTGDQIVLTSSAELKPGVRVTVNML